MEKHDMTARTLKLLVTTTAFAFTLAACSNDEAAPEGHGTPVSAQLFDTETNTALPTPYVLPSGSTTRVTVHFFDADGDDISQELIDSGHYTSLTFAPSSFATVAVVAGARFERDVTVDASAGTAATLDIGYGHDEAADEEAFGPYPITAADGAATLRTAGR
jgi:hypothetical protein